MDRKEERTASSAADAGELSPRIVLNPVLIQLSDVVPALEIGRKTVC